LWNRFNSEIIKLGFQSNHLDPCLFFKENEKARVFITLYVDDSIIAGEEFLIKEIITSLQEVFKVKVQGSLEDYLGCEVVKEEEGYWIGQRRIIEDLIGKFKVFLPGRVFDTPTLNRYVVERGVEEPLEEGKQALFRSGVGSLLYLVKHSRPDIANCVRELSKVMDRAGHNHWKALLRAIRYCEVTKDHVTQIFNTEKEKRVKLEVYSDSDYAVDKETRKSVTGYVIFMDGSPISWRSKGQKNVTLSTTEAEYVALSEATR
jgi:hypothetical protein